MIVSKSGIKLITFSFMLMSFCLPFKSFGFVPVIKLLYEKQANTYVDEVLPAIIKEWSVSVLTSYAHPDFFKATPHNNVQQLFFQFKKLGSLKEYKGAQGDIVVSETSAGSKVISGNFTASAIFENGTATIKVVILKGKEHWNITGIMVDSDLFHKTALISNAEEDQKNVENKLSKVDLEQAVEDILANDAIQKRRNVDIIFELAQIYEKEGSAEKALQLYDKALQVDAANLKRQLSFAKLLLKNDRKDRAIHILCYVYEFSEDFELFQESRALLMDMQIDLPVLFQPISKIRSDIEIVLVPIGNPHQQVLSEVRVAIQNKMGLAVTIAKESIELGPFDKNYSEKYTADVFKNITKNLTSLQYEEVASEIGLTDGRKQTSLYQTRFILKYLKRLGSEGELVRKQFEKNLKHMDNQGQFYIKSFAEKLRHAFPFDRSETIKSYIAVTSEDLGCEDCNFICGGTDGSYGVISYYRFTAHFNNEQPNRLRLVKRLLKQALSSINYSFDIPRCNTPYCARAFPNSLAEHDAKSEDLCWVCSDRLNKYLFNVKSYTSAYEYNYLGQLYSNRKEWEKAIVMFNKVLENEPNLAQVHEALGSAYYNKEQYDKAIAAYMNAIVEYDKQKEISSGSVYEKLGDSYYYNKQHDKAVEAYKKAVELGPVTDFTHIYLGNHYLSHQNYQNALEQFSEAEKSNPENTEVHFGLGRAYANLNQIQNSIKHLEIAQEDYTNHDPFYQLLGFCYSQQNS